MTDEFTKKVIEAIQAIPEGKVSTYGEIAKQAGNNRAARDVADILHHKSEEYNLPWQRIINSKGEIAFNDPKQAERQKRMLEKEGVVFNNGIVDLNKYLHNPKQPNLDRFF